MHEEQEFRFVECDRPFVYAIVDTNTMAPVFIGTVNEI
jgi:serpin B